MTDVKPWYLSRSIWGGLLALLAGVFNIADSDLTQITSLVDAAATHVTALVSVAGGLLAIYGRVKAASKIKFG